jgi:hypothetical protein
VSARVSLSWAGTEATDPTIFIDSLGKTVRERHIPVARFTKERMVMMMLHTRHLGW